ncbi:tyrosine-protein phosphatase non-receptor type 9-like [Uloborus diversus]|uniref:tyrosine-protein phosphatase non-receptor type 9-like n=1 Tax=Uloborus diversus TaxID=327109 RepID=UPI00240A042A|nr:tyrosine-protein phosphatase non-receptor type 9-like [Uloborus diversus]
MIIIAAAMASSLTAEEEQAVKEFISVINELRSTQNIGPLSWSTAVKFMMARKFDTHRALQLYEAHEIIRRKEGLIRFDPNCDPLKSELETGKFTILPTRDSGGAALALFTAGRHNPFGNSHNVTLQGVVYQLDVALESFQTQRCGVVFIYNMNDSKYSNFDYELSQKMLTLLKGGYPARLKKVLIVTAPLWFKAPFKILRLFVREKLRDRVYMVSVPQLSLHVPPSSLPQELGGNLIVDHESWLLHCLKSMTNRCGDLCDLVSAPTSPSAINGPYSPHVVRGNGLSAHHFHFMSSEGETDESSEHHSSVHEKQNSEDREKEVEVIKEISLTVQEKPVPSCSPLQENTPNDEKLSSSTPSSSLSEDSLHDDLINGQTLEEFIEHLQKKGKRGLHEEYSEIKLKSADGTFESSRLKSNLPKNRYSDVLCYDHSRVKITCQDSDPCSDYLNANFVDGFRQKNAFISTQGPLPKTFVDFWQMIWEQEVGVIVMTTRTIERSRAKCGQYWPKDNESSMEFTPFLVHNDGLEHFNDYTISNLKLTDTKTNQTRLVYHMQFTSWPDYGVPHSALAMLGFRDKVRDKQAQYVSSMGDLWRGHPLGPPIVVHCSAGIGRTGTFITLDISICRLEATGLIDVRTTVERIRSQRAHSIQMPDQYVFCHLALLEFALSRGLLQDVDLSGFNDSDSESE